MNDYRQLILTEFIDRYENSSYYKGKSDGPRKISIVLHKRFPEYGQSFFLWNYWRTRKYIFWYTREIYLNEVITCLSNLSRETKDYKKTNEIAIKRSASVF